MKLPEIFSLSTGLKHDEPFILEDFIPLDFDIERAILINTSVNPQAPSKSYDYWQIVVDFLKEQLPNDYTLVQISDGPTYRLNSCAKHFTGIKPCQAAHLIKNCKLLLSGDHLYSFLAGKYKKDSVVLYGSTSCVTNNLNYFALTICGTAQHPTYQGMESPKNINTIKPEEVVDSVLNIINRTFAKFETKHIGKSFQNSIIEVIPDSIVNPQLFPEFVFSLRMDYLHDEQALEQLLASRKYSVVADKEINIELLKRYRGRIQQLNFEVTENTSVEYCKKLKHSGVKTIFFTRATDELLNSIRFNMLDVALVESIPPTKKPLDFNPEKETLWVKTNKYILSDGKIFLSHSHWKAGRSIKTFAENTGGIFNEDDFWKDSEYFYIFKLKTKE